MYATSLLQLLGLHSADTRITNRDDHFDILTYITFPLYFAFIILSILFGTFYCPRLPPYPQKPFFQKQWQVLEPKQANQIQNDISILKLEGLFLKMI